MCSSWTHTTGSSTDSVGVLPMCDGVGGLMHVYNMQHTLCTRFNFVCVYIVLTHAEFKETCGTHIPLGERGVLPF